MVNFNSNYSYYGNNYPYSPIPRENLHESLKRKYGIGYEDFGMNPTPVAYTQQSIYHTDPLGRKQMSWFKRLLSQLYSI